jgi:hypothetical protein
MKTTLRCGTMLLGLGFAILPAAAFSLAQNQPDTTPSLGDLARQMKARPSARPAIVYTNDNLPPSSFHPVGVENSASQISSNDAETAKIAATVKQDNAARGANENYYRAVIGRLRSKLEADQKTLKDLREDFKFWDAETEGIEDWRQWQIREVCCGVDPNPPDTVYLRLKAAEASIAEDQKAIVELEDQCRRTGCSPTWLR